jgi:hypothetical protein
MVDRRDCFGQALEESIEPSLASSSSGRGATREGVRSLFRELWKVLTFLFREDSDLRCLSWSRCENQNSNWMSSYDPRPRSFRWVQKAHVLRYAEAQAVSEESWERFIPTVIKKGYSIWVTFNPRLETDFVWQRFVKHPTSDAYIVQVNLPDNPFLSFELDMRKTLKGEPKTNRKMI